MNNTSIQFIVTGQIGAFYGKLYSLVIALPHDAYITFKGMTQIHHLHL